MLGPTTGTGIEKRRTLRKSVPSNSPRNVSQSWLGPISFLFLKWWMEARYQSSFPCDRKKSDPAKRVQPVLPANIFQEMAKKQIGDCNFRSLLYLTNNYHTGTGNEKRRTLRKSVPSNSPRSVSQSWLGPISFLFLKWWMEARRQSSFPCDRKKSDPAKRVQPVLPANIFQEMAKKQIGDCNFRSLLYLTNNYYTWRF